VIGNAVNVMRIADDSVEFVIELTSDKRDYRMQLFDPRGGALSSGNSRASSS
jgi:hypothetical protein